MYFGQSKIGKLWSENNIAAFGHRYVTDTIPCYAIFQINTGETAVNSKTGYPLTLRIGNDTKIHIKSDGNVGIGTTNPIGKLHIAESTVDGNLDVVFSAAMDANCRLVLQRNHGTEHSVIGGSNTTIGDTFYPDWCIESHASTIGLKFTSKYREYSSNGPHPLKTNDVMFYLVLIINSLPQIYEID